MSSRRIYITVFILLFTISSNGQIEFIENKGQWYEGANFKGVFETGSFFTEPKGYTVVLHQPDEIKKLSQSVHNHPPKRNDLTEQAVRFVPDSFVLHSHAYKVKFFGAGASPQIIPEKPFNSVNNYLTGNDESKWASNCKLYGAVTYKNVYPNIDIRYYSSNNQLKYDWVVHPGGNPEKIMMYYEGAEKITVKKQELIISTSVGDVTEQSPYSYQVVNGIMKVVDCHYVVSGNMVKFKVNGYAPSSTLVIDPTLIFASLTGSSMANWGYTATPGPDGSFFAGGIALNEGTGAFPVSPGAFQTAFGGGLQEGNMSPYDVAIMKLSQNGSQRLYATYIGGSGNEQPHSMISDAAGNLVIAGRTASSNYPLTVPRIGTGGGYDIFITKLNAAGNALVGSVKIGGTQDDGVNIRNKSAPIPTAGAMDATLRNYGDDARSEVLLDGAGNIFLASCTKSNNFPVVGAVFQPAFGGGRQDGVLLKFNSNLSTCLFSTFLGGSGDDAAFVLAINPSTGNVYVAGGTTSSNFPGDKSGVRQGAIAGGECDGFVSIINPSGSSIGKTTYAGTPSFDIVYGIQFDKFSFPYIMGTTTGNWPVENAPFSMAGGKQFITKLQPDLSNYVYSTVWGTNSGNPNISPIAFLVDRCQNVYVSGWGGDANSDEGFDNGSSTSGLPEVNGLPGLLPNDGSDFYFFVLERNALSQLFGSHYGISNGEFGDHVDGGTSRFDANGIIYQGMCASCGNGPSEAIRFPTTPGVWGPAPPPTRACNQAALKIEMNFAGVGASLRSTINNVTYDTTGCNPLLVTLTDTLSKGKKYIWRFGDGSPDTVTLAPVNSVTHLYNGVGRYTVMLVSIDSAACNIADTAYIVLKVGDNAATPDFTAAKIPPCTNLSYDFNNISTAVNPLFSANSFEWDFGDGSPKQRRGKVPITHTFPAVGTYKVKLTVDDTVFCNAPVTIEKTIRVNPIVKAAFETPANGCVPYNAVFLNTSLAGTDFEWDFGDGTTSTNPDPTHLYPNIGTYRIRLVANDTSTCNKTDTTYFTITVHPIPIAQFDWNPKPPLENTFTNFINQSIGATNYAWDFGDGEKSNEENPRHLFNATDTFNTCLVSINAAGCADTICKDVPAIILPLLDVPNAFTPGRNGINSIVKVMGFGIGKMDWRIYNRWGQVVFKTNDRKQGWDGTFKGALQPTDVYTYSLDVEFTDGKKLRKTGDITLLR